MLFVPRYLALAVVVFFVPNSLSAQKSLSQYVDSHLSNPTCALSSMPPPQSGSTSFTQLSSPKSFSSDQVFTVPVNAYLLLDADGGINETLESVLEIDEQDILALLLLKINEWNDLMPKLQLELCNFHAVVADPIRNRGYSPSMNRWMRLNYPELMTEDPNESVQIFLTGGQSQNWGSAPDGVVLSVLQSVFFHEVGHYFGLYHTNFGTYARDTTECNPEKILLYPDNTMVGNCIPGDNSAGLSEDECEGLDRGYCTGDLVPDTPVDIGGNASHCPSVSIANINGQNCEYTPPWTNILRASGPSVLRSQITEGQKDRMLSVFKGELPPLGHPEGPNNPFQPDYSILLENSIVADNCNDFSDVLPRYLYSWSNINLVKVYDDEVNHQPVFRGRLGYEAINVLSPAFPAVRQGSSYIFDGRVRRPLFETDRGGSIQFKFDDFESGCSDDGLFFEENLDIDDVLALLWHITGDDPIESPYLKVAADVNNSGSISVADVISLVRRVLGSTETFVVPDFKMLPELAFVSDETFTDAFRENPFTATWNFQGQEYNYLQSENNSSYLGDRLEGGDRPNLLGFKHQFPSEYTQSAEAMSFKVIESGNIDQDKDTDKADRVVNLAVTDKSSNDKNGQKVKVSVSLPPGQKINALSAKFNFGRLDGDISSSGIAYSHAYPEVDVLDITAQYLVNNGAKLNPININYLLSGETGVMLYADKKSESVAPGVLFEVVVDVKEGTQGNDLIAFLGEIDFSSKGLNALDLDVLVEDFKPVKELEVKEETSCLVYNPVRNDVLTFEISTSQKQSVNLTVCDVFGSCNSFQVDANGSGEPEKFERNLMGLKPGIGYYWMTGDNMAKSGIAILN